MIKFEHTEVMNFEAAFRGMRNPMNSWSKSDSIHCDDMSSDDDLTDCSTCEYDKRPEWCPSCATNNFIIGKKDFALAMKLRNAGTDHRKFMRQILVSVDITAPRYWWAEFDTYKVGTVANSCSTMHKIHERDLDLEDFSCDHLTTASINQLYTTIVIINHYRKFFVDWNDIPDDSKIRSNLKERKDAWYNIIQLLPASYNQKRTVILNYEVLANIYQARKNHKLDEWSAGFMDWLHLLPYSQLITGGE